MLLGIDLGTSSVKALLLDESGQVHGRSSGPYRVLSPRADWVESEPREWLQAVRDAVQEAVGSRSRDVRAVGLSGQMHGVVLCDDYGTPLRPAILWADTRSGDELGTYRALGPEARSVLANPYVTGMAGPSLLWLRRHELDAYDKARWALQPKDWLRMQLTGQAGAEPSDASATLLYNIPEDRWAWEVAETLGLRHDLLAPLAPSSSRAGELLPGVATAWGLPAGIPVAMGAGDTPSAMLGTGLVHEGVMQLVLGTGAQLIVQRNEPVPDPSGRTHLYRAVGERRWYAMAAMQNAGLALDWVRRILGIEWTEAYEEAFTAPPGAEGLLFLPQLTGERTPYLDSSMRGAWIGLHLHHERRHLLRAAFEGVAFALRDGL